MKIPNEILELIQNARNKALATNGPDGPNVVPLSMVIVHEGTVMVCDCFMDKTAKNLIDDTRVSIAFWTDFVGVQMKGKVSYETEGEHFNHCTEWLKIKHPDRTLKGALVLAVDSIYDLAPTNAGVKLA